MAASEHLTLSFGRDRLPREKAETAGVEVYRYFTTHTDPALNPLTLLSHAIRGYDHFSVNADIRRRLTNEGYLIPGEKLTLKERLRTKGRIAISLVVPEVIDDDLVGEYLTEPFSEERFLDRWYRLTHPDRRAETRLSWLKD